MVHISFSLRGCARKAFWTHVTSSRTKSTLLPLHLHDSTKGQAPVHSQEGPPPLAEERKPDQAAEEAQAPDAAEGEERAPPQVLVIIILNWIVIPTFILCPPITIDGVLTISCVLAIMVYFNLHFLVSWISSWNHVSNDSFEKYRRFKIIISNWNWKLHHKQFNLN